ncbi:MAG: endolytic transglycosylase MltG, partial [Acidobacteria bacterium]
MTSSRRRPLRRLAGLLFIVILAGGAFALWVRRTVTVPVEHDSDQIVTIDQGAGTQSIVDRLSEAGIVSHPLSLKIYLRITGKGGNLKAGDYKFPS